MRTVFEEKTREELVMRIKSLNEKNTAQWGKMSLYQMSGHCVIWDSWITGKVKRDYKHMFLGKLFGKMALRNSLKDEKPIGRNAPSGAYFQVQEKTGDLELQKNKWIGLINSYANYSNPEFIHDFFGKMTAEQIGQFAYKHSDHHLRQFGA